VRAAQGELFRLYGEGKVKPLISEALPLSRAPEAMRRVSSRASVGKLVLVPGGA
jgi:NADPH2:quinone reductase